MNIWHIAYYYILRVARLRYVFIILFLLPLLLIFILGSALSTVFKAEDGKIAEVRVAIYDGDRGRFSGELTRFLASDAAGGHLRPVAADSPNAARKLVAEGNADIAAIVPSGFSEAVVQGKAAQWEIVPGGNFDKSLTGQMMLQSFLDQINSVQAAQKVLGPAAVSAAAPPAEDGQSSVEIGRLSASDKQYTALQYYAASMLVMFMLYSGMSAAIGMVTEKEMNTLARLNSLPVRPLHILLGNLLANGILAALQVAFIIGGTAVLYGVEWGSHPVYLALACFFTIVISMSLAVIVTLLVKTTKAVNAVFQTLIIVMTFLSGGFMPDIGEFVRALGSFTVSYWAVQSMLRMMLDSDATVILQHISILGYISAACLAATMLVYRKVGYHE